MNCHRNKALTNIFAELVDESIPRRPGFGSLRFVCGSGGTRLSNKTAGLDRKRAKREGID